MGQLCEYLFKFKPYYLSRELGLKLGKLLFHFKHISICIQKLHFLGFYLTEYEVTAVYSDE